MNIDKLRQFLTEHALDGILLRKRNNFSWVTEGKTNSIVQTTEQGVADLIVFQDQVYIVTPEIERRRITEEECSDLPFDVEVLSADWFEGTDGLIASVTAGKKMAADLPYEDFMVVEPELGLIRSVLGETERESYHDLSQKAAKTLEQTCREIRPGMTEKEIEAQLTYKLLQQGINVQVALVATDERIYNYRHPIPTLKKLDKYAMLVVCAERGGLVANATRFVHFGRLSDELKTNQLKAAEIDAVMNAATVPGKSAGEVIKAGIEQYKRAGFPDDWKRLHQGGLTGYESREFLADTATPHLVQRHQAYTWNPSLPGIKSEDTILVGENGNTFLTHTGDWVYQEVEVNGGIFHRPGILERE
ncbi:M24 family metallopeptidase [Halobacillus rhizosphaerae]|uniref:M24 family metallopeptidase n=1 Tax=Halobacillus rhizosphaerae TaxID=3064889 RepID=UPI00398B9270